MTTELAGERELVPLSALNHYAYCPRRCFLIHGEGEFRENVHTLKGSLAHERVDRPLHEVCAGVRVELALPVWSESLGLSGRCDAVEFRPDGTVYPVEYKHGPRRRWVNDDLQLAAQAMCLEEMLAVSVPWGAIYHEQSRRRREVEVDSDLRQLVDQTASAIHVILAAARLPPPTQQRQRCRECSMRDVCLPELVDANGRLEALGGALFEPEEDSA